MDVLRIVVHDKAAACCETFVCNASVIESAMRYFAPVIRDQRAKNGPMSISVNCDIEIFRWLIDYVTDKSPVIDVSNVVSLILSSDFLGIRKLRFDGLLYFADHLVDVIMSDVNLDHITDSMMNELLQGVNFGKLCGSLLGVQAVSLGLSVGDLSQGASVIRPNPCPNRQFVSRLIQASIGVFVDRWCTSASHSFVQCSSCRKFFNRSFPSSCLNSKGILDSRGFISSSHLPGCVCLCKSELPLLQNALTTGRLSPSIYGRALQLLERKEDSQIRSFFSAKEALCILFLSNHVPTASGESLWEMRHSPQAFEVSNDCRELVKCLLTHALPSRCDRVQLGELRSERGISNTSAACALSSGWSGLDSDWVCQKLHGMEPISTEHDPEFSAGSKSSVALGLIDQHERTVLFAQVPLVSIHEARPRILTRPGQKKK